MRLVLNDPLQSLSCRSSESPTTCSCSCCSASVEVMSLPLSYPPVHHLVFVRGVGGEVLGEVLQQDILSSYNIIMSACTSCTRAIFSNIVNNATKFILNIHIFALKLRFLTSSMEDDALLQIFELLTRYEARWWENFCNVLSVDATETSEVLYVWETPKVYIYRRVLANSSEVVEVPLYKALRALFEQVKPVIRNELTPQRVTFGGGR